MTKKKTDLVRDAAESALKANKMRLADEDAFDAAAVVRELEDDELLDQPQPPKSPAETLRDVIVLIHSMQHARAGSGGGAPSQWANAKAHIERAIQCLEEQSRLDAWMKETVEDQDLKEHSE